jgi:hypothetical protein
MFNVPLASLLLLAALRTGFAQPLITNQPQTQAVAPRTTAAFTVGASGAEPLVYQWQRNLGAGFSDLVDCTNAALMLTNVQPWDAGDYRVVITNITGASTSAVVHLYVMRPALVTTNVVLDNFDDNRFTGGTSGSGTVIETNGQFIARGDFTVPTRSIMDSFFFGWPNTTWSVPDGMTLEWRADLVSLDENATNLAILAVGHVHNTYGFHKGRDFSYVWKYSPANGTSVFSCERAAVRNTNVVLALALTPLPPNMLITARVLDKGDPNTVLYQSIVVDTPDSDRSLTVDQFQALTGMQWLDLVPDHMDAPFTSPFWVGLGVFQNTDGNQPVPTGTFDNLELWTSLIPVTRYVDVASTNATPPYTNWFTAATTIQDAVDAALPGDEIVVTNGIYVTGGRAVGTSALVNRVAVDKPLTVRSVNGPQFTIIQGYQVPGTTNGDGAIRCVYLTNGASLSGFTLTNGATRVWASGMADSAYDGGGLWCESTNAAVSNCVVAGNSADNLGGGALGGTLNNCVLTGNSAHRNGGGGASDSTLNNCVLTGNSADDQGGGAKNSTLNNCTLAGNSAFGWAGGGAKDSTLNNCVLSDNSAGCCGGGAHNSTLNNCTLTGNSAASFGGGACYGTLSNCTLTGNSVTDSADGFGGGAIGGTLNNCIVYFNTAADSPNYGGEGELTILLNYCCTTPQPEPWRGIGNITLDPQLASATHLSATSPCRGAGSAAYATGTDIDGEAWATPPSIGCDEYHTGTGTGPLSVGIAAAFTNVAVGFPVGLTALIDGRTTAIAWNFGDGGVVSNQPYTSHAWTAPGDYAVVLRAYNDNHPEGVSATVTVHVVTQPVHYVAADAANPLPPYTSWATAARNIQYAVDAAVVGGTVLVTNGTYATAGRAVAGTMTNRVAVYKPLTVRSVNGPEFTVIRGYQVPGATNGDGAIRCVYLTNGASLSGFTLTNGATRKDPGTSYSGELSGGGGLWCESITAVVSNCVVAGNSADWHGGGAYGGTLHKCTLSGNSADYGGGAVGSTLNGCTLAGNSADYGGGAAVSTLNGCTLAGNSAYDGGGAYSSTLSNCVLSGNSAGSSGGGSSWGLLENCTLTGNSVADSADGWGGGAVGGTLNNCIVYFNTARNGANFHYGNLNYCCTTPMPTNGVSNITNAPLFVDYASGDLRLQFNSPCINAGLNAYAPGPTDLDGNPRIVSGTVDIGAYEYQGTGSVISYAWLQQYRLPIDGSADATDPDADGHTTWQEWRCLSDPTNALSALRLLPAVPTGTNVTVTWQSVAGVNYFLERGTNLASPFTLLATNIVGQGDTTIYTDTNAAGLAPLFYRVGVTVP